MLKASIKKIGIIAPGLTNWGQCRQVLTGEQTFEKRPPDKFVPNLLRPNERRRTTNLIKLALQVGEQILDDCPYPQNSLCAVFASSEGDTDIIDKICTALTLPDQPVSPTQFHNSVHNAPAGYWAIATECRESSTSLSAGTASFASGLLEATTIAVTEHKPVLMISYDYPAPESLQPFVPVTEPLACALLISHETDGENEAIISLQLNQTATPSSLDNAALEPLRQSNPSGHALSLLEAICTSKQTAVLPYVGGNSLMVTLS
ncbi:MAG: beta-ketoacyl synthase chain length factor [Gammaproteobacteria bacterium]|nr:beta-ketoacyl synthase chain length factor [Gammaproteobacteria bacterium]MDH5800336.1 beta-ketoacyl synthase chain length factor [Gammaproteobacteria bacterium]